MKGMLCMYFTDETQTRFIICNCNMANRLLDIGYRITQIIPDEKNKIKSLFVFESKSSVLSDLMSISTEENELF